MTHALKRTTWRMPWLRREQTAGRWPTIRRWIVRYGPAELVAIASAFLGSVVVATWTHNEIYAAYGAAICELLGFYGTIVARDVVAESRTTFGDSRASRVTLLMRSARRVLPRTVVEFAPAEVLDASVLRPLAMGLGTNMLGRAWGVPAGKILADLAFYAAVVIGESVRRRRRARVVTSS